MGKDIVKIDSQMSKQDFGLNDNLVSVIESSRKLIEHNNAITYDNEQLQTRLNELEDEFYDMQRLNNTMCDKINYLEGENQRLTQVYKLDNLSSLPGQLDKLVLEKIDSNLIDEDKMAELFKVLYELSSYSSIIYILTSIFIDQNKMLADNELKALVLVKQISSLINTVMNKEIHHIEMLSLLDILYQTIDEDLLVDFTIRNTDYICNLILESDICFLQLNIKLARILFVLEDYVLVDNMLMILDELPNDSLILDYELTIDVVLMLICLTPYTDIEDFRGINLEMFSNGYAESKIILDYLEAIRKKATTKNQIQTLENKSKTVNNNYSEITNGIRNFAYRDMSNKLSTLCKTNVINRLHDKNKDDILKIDGTLSMDEKIYLIKEKSTVCPYDYHKLIKKKIVRKVYQTIDYLKKNIKFEYRYIEILHCSLCNTYFINEDLVDRLEGIIVYDNLGKITRTSYKKTQNSSSNVDKLQNTISMESDIFLKEKSPLRIMGYHTKLSNEARWSILINSCIPKLGVEKVLFYLKGFIDRFSKQTSKDYSDSIIIWDYDIQRIKKNYRY